MKIEEAQKFKALKRYREVLRQQRIDLDFHSEQLDLRLIKREREIQKEFEDVEHKIEVVKLTQART